MIPLPIPLLLLPISLPIFLYDLLDFIWRLRVVICIAFGYWCGWWWEDALLEPGEMPRGPGT